MRRITEVLEGLLVRDGLSAGSLAGDDALGMKGRGAASDGARSQVMADAAGGDKLHRPTAGEGDQPMGNSGKGRAVNAPAKFTGLHIVVDNSRCMPLRPTRSAQRGSGIHLVFSN